jgi:hypothetical protein|tara:strand:+ start:16 stop:435 length:420 start_codon:yes stop_codon:yes gene_type:complete
VNFIKKFLISRKLAKLTKIASQKACLAEELLDEPSQKHIALEEYFLTSIELDDIHELTIKYALNLDSFHTIYSELLRMGLGQWVNNSYVALSTISNSETLGFYLVSKASLLSESDITETLFDYWAGNIKKGSLVSLTNT